MGKQSISLAKSNIILFTPYITHHMAYKTSAQYHILQGLNG